MAASFSRVGLLSGAIGNNMFLDKQYALLCDSSVEWVLDTDVLTNVSYG